MGFRHRTQLRPVLWSRLDAGRVRASIALLHLCLPNSACPEVYVPFRVPQ
jgi:hypothetical protein